MGRLAIGLLCVAVGTGGVVTSGCGSSGDRSAATGPVATAAAATPEASIAQMKAAARDAGSVRVAGDITGATALSIDLVLADRRRGRGALTVNGMNLEVVRDADEFYVRADAAALATIFRGADTRRLAEVGERFVHVSAADPRFAQLARLLAMDGFVAELLATKGTLSTVPGKTVDGEPTFGVRDAAAGGGTIYAQVAKPCYPLLVEGAQGAIRMSDWGAPVTITAPTDTVEAANLSA